MPRQTLRAACLPDPSSGMQPAQSAPQPALHATWTAVRPTILVVDDDLALLDVLAQLVADELPDVDVHLASTSRDGERAAIVWKPDVILCDIRLPDDDGRRLLARLRLRAGLERVPGILMTALDLSAGLLREEAARLGAELLRKPFELADVLRLLERALRARRVVV